MTDTPRRAARETRPAGTRSIEAIQDAFRGRDYITDRSLATAVFLALELGRPLLLEGEAGVGKTELAKVLAASLGAPPHPAPVLRGPRRQHGRLRVELPAPDARDPAARGPRRGRPGDRPRHLRPRVPDQAAAPPGARGERRRRRRSCSSTRSTGPTRSSRRTCSRSCPTSRSRCPRSARSGPSGRRGSILTSNRTREVHDALKRRCLYHWIDYPTPQKEFEIVLARVPDAPERLAREVVGFVHRLREADLTKVPGHRRDARLGGGAAGARRARARAGARRRDARRRPQVRGGRPPGPRRARGAYLAEASPAAEPGADEWPARPIARSIRPSSAGGRTVDVDGGRLLGERGRLRAGPARGGLAVDLGAAIDFARALTLVDIGDREQVRAAGAAVFVRRRDDLEIYDEVFDRFWRRGAAALPATPPSTLPPRRRRDRARPTAARRASRRGAAARRRRTSAARPIPADDDEPTTSRPRASSSRPTRTRRASSSATASSTG